MKRSLTLILFIIAIFSVCIFSSSAQQEFTDNGLTFSVPDILKNDAAWAENNDYAYAFYDDQECMELCVSVYPNDGFTYAGMDEESLANYASSLEDYFVKQGQSIDVTDVNAYKLGNVDGLEITIAISVDEKAVYYWFATDEMCYDLDFYIYDEAYNKYISEVMNTVSIVPTEGQSNVVIPPVTEDVTDGNSGIIADNDITEDTADTEEYPFDGADDNGPEICSFKGLTIEVPAILKADPDDGTYKMWKTEDGRLFLEIYTRPNSDEEIAVDFKDEDFKTLFADIKLKDNDVKELIATENVKINGFKGIKLVYTAVYYAFEYEMSHFFFVTKDTIYEVIVTTGSDVYEGYVDSIINTVKIDGKAATNTSYYIYVAAIVLLAVIRIVSKIFKNKKAKKNAPATNNTPNYFNPQTDAYGAQYNNQQTPDQNNGYIENSGYAPDYNYSNNLDTTLTNTSDFSKTEYRNATVADMEKKYSESEVEQ